MPKKNDEQIIKKVLTYIIHKQSHTGSLEYHSGSDRSFVLGPLHK